MVGGSAFTFLCLSACSLACGEDQNDTIKNESSPASGFISYRKDTSDFFFSSENTNQSPLPA